MMNISLIQIRKTLKNLDFSDNEIKILLYLFFAKKATAQKISFRTGVSFSSTQYCLSSLLSLEIIHSLPNEENYFEIVSQNEFCEWIEKARRNQQKMYEKARDEMNNFLALTNSSVINNNFQKFEGKAEIIKIYEDMIHTKNTIYGWTNSKLMYRLLDDYVPHWVEKRAQKNIESYAIMPENKTNIYYTNKKEDKRICKLKKGFSIRGQIRIYGEKIAIINTKGSNFAGTVFENKTASRLFKSVFDMAWDKT